MTMWIPLAALLQVFSVAPQPPATSESRTMVCVNKDTVVNAVAINTCVPGLTATGFGSVQAPEAQTDGTWLTHVPYRAEKASAFETTICGIDLIDFTFKSQSGATLNISEADDPDRYCMTKGFDVPAGVVTLELRTRTKFANLVIRSSVMPVPLASILQPQAVSSAVVIPPTFVFIPPPPPPPVVVAPPVPPPPI